MGDEVEHRIRQSADEVVDLPGTLTLCGEAVRSRRVDILIYPEIGLDPVSYFLSFA